MSGQYPSGFPSPVGGHRGNFPNQMGGAAGNQMVPVQPMINMAMQNQMYYQQQQASQQQQPNMIANQPQPLQSPIVQHPNQSPMSMSGMVGMQSPSHIPSQMPQQGVQQTPQQQTQPNQMQQQQQQQQGNMTLQAPAVPHNPAILSAQLQVAQQQQQQQQPSVPVPINIFSLGRLGQETVQDIYSRFHEVFQMLKQVQPPNQQTPTQTTTEKKIQEQFRTIRLLFKRLRILFDKCNDHCQQGMEYTHIESLIPLKDEPDHRPEPAHNEEYKKAQAENRELIELAVLRNKQLREVIDGLRIIIWEDNTMLNMRRS